MARVQFISKTPDYMASIVDSREIVQAFDIYEQECKAMHKLIEKVYGDSLMELFLRN